MHSGSIEVHSGSNEVHSGSIGKHSGNNGVHSGSGVKHRHTLGFEKKIYFTQRNKSTKKNYIPIIQNLYTHTIEIQYIIYLQEACGPPHIDHYRSKLCSLYTSNDQL